MISLVINHKSVIFGLLSRLEQGCNLVCYLDYSEAVTLLVISHK